MPRLSEPVILLLGVISTALSLVVALNVGLTSDQAGLIVAAITAVFGVVAALLVRPISPVAFTTLVAAVGDLLMGFHFNVSPGVLAAISALVVAVLSLVARGHVTPVPPAVAPAPPQNAV